MVSAIVSVSMEVSMEGDEERKKEGSGMVGGWWWVGGQPDVVYSSSDYINESMQIIDFGLFVGVM